MAAVASFLLRRSPAHGGQALLHLRDVERLGYVPVAAGLEGHLLERPRHVRRNEHDLGSAALAATSSLPSLDDFLAGLQAVHHRHLRMKENAFL